MREYIEFAMHPIVKFITHNDSLAIAKFTNSPNVTYLYNPMEMEPISTNCIYVSNIDMFSIFRLFVEKLIEENKVDIISVVLPSKYNSNQFQVIGDIGAHILHFYPELLVVDWFFTRFNDVIPFDKIREVVNDRNSRTVLAIRIVEEVFFGHNNCSEILRPFLYEHIREELPL